MVGDIVATGAAVGDGCVLWMVGELYRCIGKSQSAGIRGGCLSLWRWRGWGSFRIGIDNLLDYSYGVCRVSSAATQQHIIGEGFDDVVLHIGCVNMLFK